MRYYVSTGVDDEGAIYKGDTPEKVAADYYCCRYGSDNGPKDIFVISLDVTGGVVYRVNRCTVVDVQKK